ncbi:energy transducer TonB [Niabella hibiscisoli]|uniref:energy transducer TonB n=1 Tax=Niabella hibiscisoli TaxID=1825928 RepID=UPI001F0FA681|nr:energy transducer TonB [Niabella hibiscisoli]MCH5715853.1 energy transducer TonB [Niabella hibiscisoli]
MGEGQYRADIQFVIDSRGKVTDVAIRKSSGNEILDQYALEIITKSKNWVPAVQYGRFVKAYRIQPVSFEIADFR